MIYQHVLLSGNMVELPDDQEWDMIVLDIDGTLLDRDGIIPEMIHIVRAVSYTHLTLPTKA